MLRLHFSESAQISGLDMAAAGGRGPRASLLRAGVGGDRPAPRDPFSGWGSPTAVDEEPAPGRVLPQNVLRLAHVLPGVLHLHLVELQSRVLSGWGGIRGGRGVSCGSSSLPSPCRAAESTQGGVPRSHQPSLGCGWTAAAGLQGDLGAQENTEWGSWLYTVSKSMDSHIPFSRAGTVSVTVFLGEEIGIPLKGPLPPLPLVSSSQSWPVFPHPLAAEQLLARSYPRLAFEVGWEGGDAGGLTLGEQGLVPGTREGQGANWFPWRLRPASQSKLVCLPCLHISPAAKGRSMASFQGVLPHSLRRCLLSAGRLAASGSKELLSSRPALALTAELEDDRVGPMKKVQPQRGLRARLRALGGGGAGAGEDLGPTQFRCVCRA